MYVCICNAVTESHIGAAVADGCRSMRELRERLGVGACCGRCSSCARKLMHEAIAPTPAPAPAPATQEIHFATAAA